ncbi:MAG: class I SAM-dependent methyltransferase, partial [Candidatus Omnitrophica bacterium]|nr:class I SAM-dependent methyltransferase [Candidatus Omnitrophota bacterium]
FHGSESAYWENADDIAAGVLQAVPNAPGTEIILESTPNGPGNWFHTKAMLGLSEGSDGDFRTIFVPWYWQEEYSKTPPKEFCRTEEEEGLVRSFGLTDGQLYWRRGVISDAFGGDVWRFKREYPNTVEEGFGASGTQLIAPALVIAGRKCQSKDPFSPIVGGCDPARTNDRTVMILRRGREIVKCSKYNTMDEMTCAGLIAQDIEKYQVVKYFVDVGCGYGTIDRLRELGFGSVVTGIHFGATALQSEVYGNKRAEMADLAREWFESGGVNIPDTDDFQADIVAIPPLRTQGSRGRLHLPPKDEIKKVLGRSSDYFDALILTFAFPVASRAAQSRIQRVELDTRRPNSPLSTVRDFNHTGRKPTTHTSSFTLK